MMHGGKKWKFLKWLGYSTLGIVLLLVTLLTGLSFTYDKAIVKHLKKYLNEHLLTEIIVDNIDFSMIRKFPYATVEFSNVVIRSKAGLNYAAFEQGDEDTLMSASKVYFQFGLIGLMKNEYLLKRVHLVEGKINILVDKTGRNNYSIWKSGEKGKMGEEDYHIEFKNVIVSSFNLCYNNKHNPFELRSFIKRMIFTGSYSGDAGLYTLKSDMQLINAGMEGKSYIKNLSVYVDLEASSLHDSLHAKQARILLNKLPVHIVGSLLLDPSMQVDLTLTSPNFGLDEILSLFPQNDQSRLNDFAIEGKGKIMAHIRGPLFTGGFPRVDADFNLSNGSVTNKNTRSKLSHVSIAGTFSGDKPENFRLVISQTEARLSMGKINGKATVSNFLQPAITAEINSTINLNNLYQLIEYDTIEYLSGMMQAHLRIEGLLPKGQHLTASTLFSGLKYGTFEIEDGSVKLKGLDYALQDINGRILMDNRISFQDFAINLNQTNFLVTGTVDNLLNYLIDNKSIITTNLYLYSKVLDGNSFIRNRQPSSQGASGISFPGFLDLKAKIHADEFRIGKFDATAMKCDVVFAEKILNINDFNLKFIDGSISGKSLIRQADDSCLLISCMADLNYIDIQRLFASFNNFSQHFILDENLRGKLGGKVTFAACWDNRTNFVPSSLTAKADIEIINGELLKFDPMLSLSKYINVEELKHIKFKTLKNTISIFEQNIMIPEMFINTSAFSIALSGMHSFDNNFDYRLRVALSDVLFKKAKRKKKEIEDYLIMENDREKTVIPVSIIGNPDDFKVEFDSKRAFDLIKGNIQHQGTGMKDVYGGNGVPSEKNTGEKPDQPVILWDDDPSVPKPQEDIKTVPSGDEIRIKWEEEDSSDFDFFN